MKSIVSEKPQITIPQLIDDFLDQADQVILGKREQVKLALCTILAEGHLLIEDVPGVGKTTLVRLLAKALGLTTSRIQFTNDLLPADILGISIFDTSAQQFKFHKGPIFGQLVIADELNRATPKTQGACLQAMEERKVTVDGATYLLPEPFVVIATQNPQEQMGTYPLPESQLDRFLMRIHLGYPEKKSEKLLLKSQSRDSLLKEFKPFFEVSELLSMQKEAEKVHVSDPLIDYLHRILEFSRNQSSDQLGLSPRAGLALLRAAKAWAFMKGHAMVLPEDIQAVGKYVISHRLNPIGETDRFLEQDRAEEIISSVKVD